MPPCVDPTREIRLHGRRIGEIRRLALDRLEFRYDASYAGAGNAAPLSTCLPVETGKSSRERASAWFNGLLPEGVRRQQLSLITGTHERDLWTLLDAAGAECAGAVQIVNPVYEDKPSLHRLDEDELARLLHSTPVEPIGTVDRGARISLAGAQDKVALTRGHDGSWAVPLAGAMSSHILKPQSKKYRGMVENEHWCMTIARESGIDAARTELMTSAGAPVLVVERYDRTRTADGERVRVHQEDLAQALGRTEKYEADGGPSVAEIATVPGVTRAVLYQLVLNWIVGNADGHAKNISVLEPGTERARLAPAYDVLCTETYPGVPKDHAIRIGGARYPGEVSMSAIERCGATLGISKEESREMVAALGARVSEAAESLRLRPDGLRVTVTDLVQHRAERASRLLEEPSAARPEKQRPRPTRADCR